jgi:hypothetical protein
MFLNARAEVRGDGRRRQRRASRVLGRAVTAISPPKKQKSTPIDVPNMDIAARVHALCAPNLRHRTEGDRVHHPKISAGAFRFP